ncbi:hypothetical protein [Pontibacter roseus]|uniref:hypothetical protein n=1 Tax=Pontibacter roseus TaxID=336989 RepID=UPI00035D0220|nr:hypothetical protein [Pontibacter roseus]
MFNRYALLYLLVLNCCQAFGQDTNATSEAPGLKKNAVHATLGTIGLMGAYTFSYDRNVIEFDKGVLQGIWARAGAGGWASWTSGGPYQSVTVGVLTGRKSSHVEFHAGAARMFDRSAYDDEKDLRDYYADPKPAKSEFTDIRAVGSLGYRYQKPGGHFLFRVGAGFPETAYVGLGIAF